MGIGLLLALIVIGILFAVRIYIYENSEFYKITGYSLFNIWSNSRIKNLYKIAKSINLHGEKKLLFNVVLNNQEKELIDAIVIHESGIYVIDVMAKNGWIYGREQDAEWAQALYKKEELEKFDNPIINMKRLILDLRESLKDVNPELFHTVVAFSNQCTLRKIVLDSNDVTVIQLSDLKSFWSSISDEKLTKEEINKIYSSLETFVEAQQPSKQMKMKHAATN